MTASLDEDVVDFVPNYDGRENEPVVLPGGDPEPARQRRVRHRGRHGHQHGPAQPRRGRRGRPPPASRTRRRRSTTSWASCPAPTCPSGGKIVGLDGVREAYETGRGAFRIAGDRARRERHAAPQGHRRHRAAVQRGPGEGHRSASRRRWTPRSSRASPPSTTSPTWSTGLRLVIEVQERLLPEAVLEQLYALTPMEDSFDINNVALVEGQPRTLGLREHARGVRRRTGSTSCAAARSYRRRKAEERLHLVDGLLVAILDIDEVIALIRSSRRRRRRQGAADPGVRPVATLQATYILEMPLRRLTKFSRLELETERDELRARIAELSRDPRRREAPAPRGQRRAAPPWPRSTAHRAAPCCSSRSGAPTRRGRGAARGHRRPVRRCSCRAPACSRARPTTATCPPTASAARTTWSPRRSAPPPAATSAS